MISFITFLFTLLNIMNRRHRENTLKTKMFDDTSTKIENGDGQLVTVNMKELVKEEDEIPEDAQCGICRGFLYPPITLACQHTFCRLCLLKGDHNLRCPFNCPPPIGTYFVNTNIKFANWVNHGYVKFLEDKYPNLLKKAKQKIDQREKWKDIVRAEISMEIGQKRNTENQRFVERYYSMLANHRTVRKRVQSYFWKQYICLISIFLTLLLTVGLSAFSHPVPWIILFTLSIFGMIIHGIIGTIEQNHQREITQQPLFQPATVYSSQLEEIDNNYIT